MTYRIFAEDTIVPLGAYNGVTNGAGNQRTVNLRNLLREPGPHQIQFGVRTVVADAAAAFCQMRVIYETANGQLRTMDPGPADLSVIDDASGAMWYQPQQLTVDKFYPNGDGPGTDPYGTFQLIFNCGTPGTAKISYECIVYSFDGSSTVVNIP